MGLVKNLPVFFKVFTNKLLFVEWILEILRALSIYFLRLKAEIEVDNFIEDNPDTEDLRKIPDKLKKQMIYDEAVLKERWDACSSCEFLTDGNRCTKCGCFMKIKHKIIGAQCPIGKWDRYKPGAPNGT